MGADGWRRKLKEEGNRIVRWLLWDSNHTCAPQSRITLCPCFRWNEELGLIRQNYPLVHRGSHCHQNPIFSQGAAANGNPARSHIGSQGATESPGGSDVRGTQIAPSTIFPCTWYPVPCTIFPSPFASNQTQESPALVSTFSHQPLPHFCLETLSHPLYSTRQGERCTWSMCHIVQAFLQNIFNSKFGYSLNLSDQFIWDNASFQFYDFKSWSDKSFFSFKTNIW